MGARTTKGDTLFGIGSGRSARHAVPATDGQAFIADSSQTDGWIADFPLSRTDAYWRPTGAIAETISRRHGGFGNLAASVSGSLYCVGIVLPANRLVTSLTLVTGSTALGGGSNQWFALVDNALNVLAKTTDDTSTAWAANSAKTLNLNPAFTTTYSGLYYLCPLIVATTMPTWTGTSDNQNAFDLVAPAVAGTSTTGLTNPASLGSTITALGGSANKKIWGWAS